MRLFDRHCPADATADGARRRPPIEARQKTIGMQDTSQTRQGLDQRYLELPPLEAFQRPAEGWLRTIRLALGMTTAQFAERYGRPQSRICTLEQAELTGAVSLKTLAEAADALDCDVVYAVIPRRPLDDIVRERAERLALRQAEIEDRLHGRDANAPTPDCHIDLEARVQQLLSGKLSLLWRRPAPSSSPQTF
jgi:predicted DNA-binding mobile mystery protein A